MVDAHSSKQDMQEVQTLLEQQLDYLQQLFELQEQELQHIQENNAPVLLELNEKKSSLLAQLEQQHTILQSEPYMALFQSKPFAQKRHHIEHLLVQVQEQNELNGQVIRRSLGRIQTLKQELHRQKGEHTTTYTAKGYTASSSSSKGIKV